MSATNNPIPPSEVETLLSRIKTVMWASGFAQETIDGTNIQVIHPQDWEISLFVPYKGIKIAFARNTIGNILIHDCGVDDEYCEFFGKRKDKGAYEWYFRHPNIPLEVAARVDAEIEEEEGEQVAIALPFPSESKSNSDTVFLSLKDEFFKRIQSGEKTIEYRNLNQYYFDKFFSPGVKKRYVKFNRGYQSGAENQMVFEINDIVLLNDMMEECPAVSPSGAPITELSLLPEGFHPTSYAIKLGRRIA